MVLKSTSIDVAGDYILSITTIVQALIMLLQLILGDSGLMDKDFVSLIRVAISGLFTLFSFYWICKRRPLLFVGLYLLAFILFSISILLSPNNKDAIFSEGIRFTLCICIPIFLSMASISNIQIFHRVCLVISLCCFVIGIVYGFLFVSGKLILDDFYNMSYGYALLFPTMYFIYRGSSFYLLLGFLLFLFMLLCGSRGPLVPVLLFFIWKSAIRGGTKTKMIFFCVIVILILLFPLMLNILDNIGFDSRTLYLFLNGEIGNDSNRSELHSVIMQKIELSPFWGYGVFGDRFFLDGGYCHNIFIELVVDFGVFLPILIILLFLFYYWCNLKHLSNLDFDWIFLLGLMSCIPLLVSSSYLIDFRFFLFLGTLSYYVKHKKKFIASKNITAKNI